MRDVESRLRRLEDRAAAPTVEDEFHQLVDGGEFDPSKSLDENLRGARWPVGSVPSFLDDPAQPSAPSQ